MPFSQWKTARLTELLASEKVLEKIPKLFGIILPPPEAQWVLCRGGCPRESQSPAGCAVVPAKCWRAWRCALIDRSRFGCGGHWGPPGDSSSASTASPGSSHGDYGPLAALSSADSVAFS